MRSGWVVAPTACVTLSEFRYATQGLRPRSTIGYQVQKKKTFVIERAPDRVCSSSFHVGYAVN